MPRTSSVRQLLAGRAHYVAALALAGLLAVPLGACGGEVSAGNGAGGGGGTGGAQQCSRKLEYASVSVTPYNGCGSPELSTTLVGVVRNAAGGKIIVDKCHPNENCVPVEYVITLSGTDLSVSIPDGTFVQVHVYSKPFPVFGCVWHVTVRNLPTWGGTPNPTSDGTFLWLAHHYTFDRDYSLPDDPYQTQREFVCGEYSAFEVYAFRFSFPDAPGAEVFAPQGQTVTWSVPSGEHAGEYRVRNVRAVIDTHAEYSYWIARQ